MHVFLPFICTWSRWSCMHFILPWSICKAFRKFHYVSLATFVFPVLVLVLVGSHSKVLLLRTLSDVMRCEMIAAWLSTYILFFFYVFFHVVSYLSRFPVIELNKIIIFFFWSHETLTELSKFPRFFWFFVFWCILK